MPVFHARALSPPTTKLGFSNFLDVDKAKLPFSSRYDIYQPNRKTLPTIERGSKETLSTIGLTGLAM